MKQVTIILINCLLVLNAFAQSEKKIKLVKESFWGQNDLATKDMNIPEKWENESAVILFKNIKYDYNKFGNNLTYTSSVRKQILLKDEASIDRYSEFSKKDNFFTEEKRIWSRVHNEFIGIRIIKPDGKIDEIEIKEVSVEKDGESYISIPNLEIGDVLDYYILIKQGFVITTSYVFQPVEKLIAETYPIKSFKMNFNVDNGFYINFNSFNGAPDLIPLKTDTKKNRTYEITAHDIEKIKNEKWSYLYNALPCYKMQVYYSKTSYDKNLMKYYTSESENKILKRATEEDIKRVAKITSSPLVSSYFFQDDLEQIFQDNNRVELEKQLEFLYYHIRYKYSINDMDYHIYSNENVFDGTKFKYQNANYYLTNRNMFLNYFVKYLTHNKIDYKLIVAKKRFDGSIDDLLLSVNTQLIIQINLPNKSFFIDWHELNGNFNTISPYLLSTEAYAMSIREDSKLYFSTFTYENLEKITLPISKSEDHVSIKKINIDLNDLETINIEDYSEMYGYMKGSAQSGMLSLFDIVNDDYKYFDRKPFIESIRAKDNQIVAIKNRINAFKNTIEKDTKESVRESVENEYEFTLEDEFEYEILETGRFKKDTPFIYTTNFSIKDQLIKKAGSNYILEIGRFIGPQQSIKDDELDRQFDIDMISARQYKNSIEIKIPDGFEIKGIEKLNKSIDNETASFTSSASIENGKW